MKIHFEYDRSYLPPAPVVTLTVDGYSNNVPPVTIQAMVDSGADGTMLPTAVLNQIQASYVDSVRMSGVTGTVERRDRYRVRLQMVFPWLARPTQFTLYPCCQPGPRTTRPGVAPVWSPS
ncbi:MAG: aspartyl protease family protein [Candidatus Promineifilaceae bacterium]